MMQPAPEKEVSVQPSGHGPFACLWCHKRFRPKKPNQRYCRPPCRKKSLRYRQKHEGPQLPPPRISPRLTIQAQQAQRLQANVALLLSNDYLTSGAGILEAKQQFERWKDLLRQRQAHHATLGGPPMPIQYFQLEPGKELPPNLEATHCAVVSTDGQIGFIAFGYAPDPSAQAAAEDEGVEPPCA